MPRTWILRILIVLALLTGINAYGWGMHLLLEGASDLRPHPGIECFAYSGIDKAKTAIRERSQNDRFFDDRDAFEMGIADMSVGENSSTHFGYFRLHPPDARAVILCFFEWEKDKEDTETGYRVSEVYESNRDNPHLPMAIDQPERPKDLDIHDDGHEQGYW